VYLRELLNHFNKRPYGWPDNEILLLIARLNLTGTISFTYQNIDLSLKKSYENLTNTRKQKETRIQKLRKHDEQQINKAKILIKNLFHKTITTNATNSEEKEIVQFIKDQLTTWKDKLNHFQSTAKAGQEQYPGIKDIESGITLVSNILEQGNSYAMVDQFLSSTNDLEDFAEEFEDLDDFYTSQLQTWQLLIKSLNQDFKPNQLALEKDQQALSALNKLNDIFKSPAPYNQINRINGLIETVEGINQKLIKDKQERAINRVDKRIDSIQQFIKETGASSEISNKALSPLQQCKTRIQIQTSISHIFSEQSDAAELEDDAFDLINAFINEQKFKEQELKEQELIKQKAITKKLAATPPTPDEPDNRDTDIPKVEEKPKPYVKPIKTIDPSDLYNNSNSQFIETEDDINNYLNQIKKTMLQAIKDGSRIRIK
jgi:hypothetical protein